MKTYFITTLSTVFLIVVLDTLVSKSKNGVLVKTVISLVVTTVLAGLITSIITKNNVNHNFQDFQTEYKIYLLEYEKSAVKSQILVRLEKEGYNDISISFLDNGINITKVSVKIAYKVINGEIEHIFNLEPAEKIVKEIVGERVEVCVETV